MKCKEVMNSEVKCCGTEEPIARVAATMRDENIGFMPVCDEMGRAIGTVTDRDLAIRAVAECFPADTTQVKEVMTREVVSCRPEDDLRSAEQLMSQHKISRMICVETGGRPVGVISLSDIADVESRGRAAAVLRSVSQRETHP
jgi:CBS domain-containing protein